MCKNRPRNAGGHTFFCARHAPIERDVDDDNIPGRDVCRSLLGEDHHDDGDDDGEICDVSMDAAPLKVHRHRRRSWGGR